MMKFNCGPFSKILPKKASYAKAALAATSLAISNDGKKGISKKFKKACRTRWLSTEMAIAEVYEDFIPQTQTLRVYKEDNDCAAIGLLKQIGDVKFLSTVYFLHEVLPALSHLSKAFQRGTISFSAIEPAIKYSTDQLKEIATSQIPLERLKRLSSSEVILTSFHEQYLRNLTVKYDDSLIENIDNRFAESLPVLCAFKIFDQMAVPCRTDKEFMEYGMNDLKHPPKNENLVSQTSTEWALQHILAMRTTYMPFIPMLLHIAEVCLSLPVSNAWPERGASAVKRVKTRLQSSIKHDMLEALMHVAINGPDVSEPECSQLITATAKKWSVNRKKLAKRKPAQPQATVTSVDATAQTDPVVQDCIVLDSHCLVDNKSLDNLESDLERLAAMLTLPLPQNMPDEESELDESNYDTDSEF